MTCIVTFSTKRAFAAAVAERQGAIAIEDPSMFAPFVGRLGDYMVNRDAAVFTNHPKRSWFAQVVRGRDGRLKVK